MQQPTLFGLSRSAYTRIVRLALEEKGVGYALNEVEIFGEQGVPADHYERHPFGRIPVLAHGDFTLYETGAITRYIDEAFPGPALQPTNPRQRARMHQIVSLLDAYAYRPMIWGMFVQRVSVPWEGGTPDEQIIAEALPVVDRCVQTLETFLDRQPCFAGDAISLADLHAAPMLLYLLRTPEGQSLLAPRPNLARWVAAIRQRRSVEVTRSIYD